MATRGTHWPVCVHHWQSLRGRPTGIEDCSGAFLLCDEPDCSGASFLSLQYRLWPDIAACDGKICAQRGQVLGPGLGPGLFALEGEVTPAHD